MEKKFTTEELFGMLAESMDNPLDSETDSKVEAELFNQLGRVDGIHAYFKNMMGKDILLYFQATSDEDRRIIRGAYQRVAHMKSLMTKYDKVAT